MDEAPKFTRQVWAQLWRVTRPFFFDKGWTRAWGLVGLLVAFSVTVTLVSIRMNEATGTFTNGLVKHDVDTYQAGLRQYIIAFAIAIPLAGFYRFTEERLALRWRDYLARTLMKRYFNNRAYYRLGSHPEIDNPDQRISEDVRNFTTTALSLFLILMNSTIQIVMWSHVLHSISSRLVAALVIYSVVGTLVAYFIGRRLIGLNYLQYGREADFRYGLVRVRDNAESIAFYRGERRELRDLRARLGAVVGNMIVLIRWNRNLAFYTTGYNYLALIIPTVIVVPLYLRGEVPFGDITRAGGAFGFLLAALSLIITQFERLSAFAAGVTRLGALSDYLDEQDAEDDLDTEGEQISIDEDQRTINLENLTVKTPNGQRVLLRDLTFRLPPGKSLLIMGESGSGKSSLLRTIAGLWSCGEGHIGRPPYRNMMFLPQRPYMIPGSLRDQLEYPGGSKAPGEDRLMHVLDVVNLPKLAARVDNDFDRIADWANMLSLGEMQRLSFARLLIKKPAIAFLDESTSALDEPNEERLYNYLKEHRYTYVSVGHRSTLLRYHDWLLRIGKEDGDWEIIEAADAVPFEAGTGVA